MEQVWEIIQNPTNMSFVSPRMLVKRIFLQRMPLSLVLKENVQILQPSSILKHQRDMWNSCYFKFPE